MHNVEGDMRIERSLRDFAGVSSCRLSTAEQFVLGVCRCWDIFAEHPDPGMAWRELSPIFAFMNVMSALCAFERTFAVLRRHRPTLRFEDTDSPVVGEDEARLLCGLACLQRGDARATIEALRGPLTRCAVAGLVPPLARIAAILDAQGHRLPPWRSADQRR